MRVEMKVEQGVGINRKESLIEIKRQLINN